MTGATQELHFPSFNYHLDESDPDIVILRRQDDAFVAAFSARGASREGIVEAAEQDYAAVLRENPGSLAVVEAEKPQRD
jgi:hypothetical protein